MFSWNFILKLFCCLEGKSNGLLKFQPCLVSAFGVMAIDNKKSKTINLVKSIQRYLQINPKCFQVATVFLKGIFYCLQHSVKCSITVVTAIALLLSQISRHAVVCCAAQEASMQHCQYIDKKKENVILMHM